MKNRTLPALLLCSLMTLGPALAGVGTLPAAVATRQEGSTGPLKIMLAGDSITQGFDGDYTWRYRLDRELRRQGVDFDFVGPRKYTYGGANHYQVSARRTDGSQVWDSDHDATGGTRLRTAMSALVQDMAANPPDVLVALYGTTDLLPRDDAVPRAEEIEDLRTYVCEAREVNPNVDVVLGEVTTRRIPDRQQYNDALKVLAQDLNKTDTACPDIITPDSRVVIADLDYEGWDPSKNTYDTTHPTPVGEAIIAQRIGWALKALGYLPQNPGISAAGLKWAPPWAPKIRVSTTRRIVTDWYDTKWLNKPQMMRIWIKDLRTGKSGMSAWTTARSHVSASKRPGRYQIRIQGRRQAMISPWSKTWTVTVRR